MHTKEQIEMIHIDKHCNQNLSRVPKADIEQTISEKMLCSRSTIAQQLSFVHNYNPDDEKPLN